MHRIFLYCLFIAVAVLALGCDAELVPPQNDSVGQNVPVKPPPMARSYTVNVPSVQVTHGKEIESTWQGKVVAIIDGDTIKVLNDQNEQIKVRLESIDAPERKQPFGEVAKNLLGTLIHERTVTVKKTCEDRYGRTLAFIELPLTDATLDICSEMVGMGYAWEYKQYSKSKTLGGTEEKARNGKRGLWAGAGPDDQVPPWEWHRRK